jgi:hypothetical protein
LRLTRVLYIYQWFTNQIAEFIILSLAMDVRADPELSAEMKLLTSKKAQVSQSVVHRREKSKANLILCPAYI